MLEGRIAIEGDAKTLTREQITDAYFGHNHKRSQAEKAS
jgi:hypothetical protein